MSLASAIIELNKLKKEYDSLKISPENLQKLWRKFRLEWNWNSNHIEGNTLTYGQTKLLLIFDQTTGNHEMREYEEMKAHDVAIKMVQDGANDKERPLTESFIRKLNETLLVRPFWKEAITQDGQPTRREIIPGEYKKFPNSVRLANGEIFEYANPVEVPARMQELVEKIIQYENKPAPDAIYIPILGAVFHYEFVRIHPFDDGNGRVARLLNNYILLKHGYLPLIIKSEKKAEYLAALQQADTGDGEAFYEYIISQLNWSYEIGIKAARGESIDEEMDLDKKITMLKQEIEADGDEGEYKMYLSLSTLKFCMDSWGYQLLRGLVDSSIKLNDFYDSQQHELAFLIINANKNFKIQDDSVIDELKNHIDNGIDNQDFDGVEINFFAKYGIYKKSGLHPFSCHYQVSLNFNKREYALHMDIFRSGRQYSQELFMRNLLHKVPSQDQLKEAISQFGNSLYEYTKYNIERLKQI